MSNPIHLRSYQVLGRTHENQEATIPYHLIVVTNYGKHDPAALMLQFGREENASRLWLTENDATALRRAIVNTQTYEETVEGGIVEPEEDPPEYALSVDFWASSFVDRKKGLPQVLFQVGDTRQPEEPAAVRAKLLPDQTDDFLTQLARILDGSRPPSRATPTLVQQSGSTKTVNSIL